MSITPTTLTRSKRPLAPLLPDSQRQSPTTVNYRSSPSRQPATRTGSMFTLQKEPEDARMTGGTRSLDRRLLALNLSLPRTTPTRD